MTAIRRLKVCLNGSRRRKDHPGVPLSPTEVATAAAAAVAAGAEAIHVHPRGADGAESLRAADIAAAVDALRRACPGVAVGVSTGVWMTAGDPVGRERLVRGWGDLPAAARPDFASVNVSEPGYAELVGTLRGAGIGVEAGVWSVDDADALAAATRGDRLLRVLVEVIGVAAEDAVAAAARILARLDEHAVGVPRLLHGEEAACWPLVAEAGRLGCPTRIGLEDTLRGPDGRPAVDNADLVRSALTVWAHGVRKGH
jgi:uncharacterized protein (DUF849 family)